MKVYPDQFQRHAQGALAAIYVIAGEEPLLVEETLDQLRHKAKADGYLERNTWHVQTGFDWGAVIESSQSLSLFSDRRLIELRIPGGKPDRSGEKGSKVLIEYAARPADDTILVVIADSLDRSVRNAKWYKTLEKSGVLVECWALDRRQLNEWLQRRLAKHGFTAERDALQLIVDRVEGNLLAAAQDIDRLALLVPPGSLDSQTVMAAITNSARYTPFDLVNGALDGAAGRVPKILLSLRGEGVEPLLIVGTLRTELRTLSKIAAGDQSAIPRYWPQKAQRLERAVRRFDALRWQQLLAQSAILDRMAKGMARGEIWDELLKWSMDIAGQPLTLSD